MANPGSIAIYTFTLGRDYYLRQCLESVVSAARGTDLLLEHHLCLQGASLSEEVRAMLSPDLPNLRFIVHAWPENYGIAGGHNRIVGQLEADLIVKLDDDCRILSPDFFVHVVALHKAMPNAVFSPFPVGLLRSIGGPPPADHRLVYSADTDTYYTLRRVSHIGGLCRIAPRRLVGEWRLQENLSTSGTEDSQHSALCLTHGIEMFYTENALVVEHLETARGQAARLGEYFEKKGRRRTNYRRLRLGQKLRHAVARRLLKLVRALQGY